MKYLGIAMILNVGILLAGCGSTSSTSTNINGHWTAALSNPNGNPAFSFTVNLTQHSDDTISGTNLVFTSANPCFDSGATVTGALNLMGTFSGITGGGFQLSIQETAGSGGTNSLNMTGAITDKKISGNWTLSGLNSGCTGSGNFTFTRS